MFAIPENLGWLGKSDEGRAWLSSLPTLVAQAAGRWGLRVGAGYGGSQVSYVAPAYRADGSAAVLKVQWPHPECVHEADALTVWDGDGAVRLLAHDPGSHTLLIERCVPGTHLSTVDSRTALDVLIGLLPRLWKPAGAPFTSLAAEAARWADGLIGQWDRAGRPGPRPIVDRAVEVLRGLASGQAGYEQVVGHQDLHGDNVLRAEREPWLVIDPKPLVGERAFGVAPIVRSAELGHSKADVWYRLDRLTAELGLDRDRAWGWAYGHTVAWAFDDGYASPRHIEVAEWLSDRR